MRAKTTKLEADLRRYEEEVEQLQADKAGLDTKLAEAVQTRDDDKKSLEQALAEQRREVNDLKTQVSGLKVILPLPSASSSTYTYTYSVAGDCSCAPCQTTGV
jgi:predicted  nucleic acid-binding Zn-ribbon protein